MEGESKSLVSGKLSSPSCSPPSLSSSLGNTGREEGADHTEPRAKLHPVLRQRLELQAAKGSPTLTVAGRWSPEPESHPVSLALPSSSPLKMESRSLASSFPALSQQSCAQRTSPTARSWSGTRGSEEELSLHSDLTHPAKGGSWLPCPLPCTCALDLAPAGPPLTPSDCPPSSFQDSRRQSWVGSKVSCGNLGGGDPNPRKSLLTLTVTQVCLSSFLPFAF